ncbi:MAG: glucans biosynthesis glucosyltransferase MdoH [Pseudomonadota bacterium]
MLRADVTNSAAPLAVTLPRATLGAPAKTLAWRRGLVLGLNTVTIVALTLVMGSLLFSGGVTPARVGMMVAYVITLPWLSIGFWNSTIGAILIASGRAGADAPRAPNPAAPLRGRTAIAMAIRNEDTAPCFARLRAMLADLEEAGLADHFDIHVLSDTNDPKIAAEEEAAIAAWRATTPRGAQIFYRRRTDNRGYKAGNLEEFCARTADTYAYFLPLDADSYMSAAAMADLVRTMDESPNLGLLQTLVVGRPSDALFTRVFQFGMRHGMRTYTAGSAWWTGDCGPYWGHNAIIRMRPFKEACALPTLPGKGPLSGPILSHDQVEAVLMRRAGYDVRVLPVEGESFEENPPSLPDFIRRETRWCQGNMQYFQLLGMKGLKPVSRVQLALAILMYLGPPAWMAFLVFGALTAFEGPAAGFDPLVGLGLFIVIMTMSFAPKLIGLFGILANSADTRRYGGRRRILGGAALELVLSTLMAPVIGFALAVFAVGLLFGRTIKWSAQMRESRTVTWREAARTFWPQTLFGLALGTALTVAMPSVLPWAAPVLIGLTLAIPVAVFTASRRVGALSVRTGLCDIPEDRAPQAPLLRLDGELARA